MRTRVLVFVMAMTLVPPNAYLMAGPGSNVILGIAAASHIQSCPDGSQPVNDSCPTQPPPTCPDGSQPVNGQCPTQPPPTCPDGSQPVNGQCPAQPPPSCPDGSQPVNGQCPTQPPPSCPDGSQPVNGQCPTRPPPDGTQTQCAPDQFWDGSRCVSGSPPPQCPPDQFWDGQKCVSSTGGSFQCPPDQFWDGTKCVSGGGAPQPQCPQGQYWDGTKCISAPPPGAACPEGQFWDGQMCREGTPPPQCPAGTYWNFEKQTCTSSSEGPTAVSCPEGQYWDGHMCAEGTPPPPCPDGTYYNFEKKECAPFEGGGFQCPPDNYWDGQRCVNAGYSKCPEGQYFDGQKCAEGTPPPPNDCPAGSWWDPYRQTCMTPPPQEGCGEGKYWDGAACIEGQPPSQCPPGQYFDFSRQSCTEGAPPSQCPPGQFFDGFRCREGEAPPPCPPGSYFNWEKRECVEGGSGTFHCPPGATWNQEKKYCEGGQGGPPPGCEPGGANASSEQCRAPPPGACPPYSYFDPQRGCVPAGQPGDCPAGQPCGPAPPPCEQQGDVMVCTPPPDCSEERGCTPPPDCKRREDGKFECPVRHDCGGPCGPAIIPKCEPTDAGMLCTPPEECEGRIGATPECTPPPFCSPDVETGKYLCKPPQECRPTRTPDGREENRCFPAASGGGCHAQAEAEGGFRPCLAPVKFCAENEEPIFSSTGPPSCIPPPPPPPKPCAEGESPTRDARGFPSCFPRPRFENGVYRPPEGFEPPQNCLPPPAPCGPPVLFAPPPPEAGPEAYEAWKQFMAGKTTAFDPSRMVRFEEQWGKFNETTIKRFHDEGAVNGLFARPAFDGQNLTGAFVNARFGEGFNITGYEVGGRRFFDSIRVPGLDETPLVTTAGTTTIASSGAFGAEFHNNGAGIARYTSNATSDGEGLGAVLELPDDLSAVALGDAPASCGDFEEQVTALGISLGEALAVCATGGLEGILVVPPGTEVTGELVELNLSAGNAFFMAIPEEGVESETRLDIALGVAAGEVGAEVSLMAREGDVVTDFVDYTDDTMAVTVENVTSESLTLGVESTDEEGQSFVLTFDRETLPVPISELVIEMDDQALNEAATLEEALDPTSADYYVTANETIVQVVVGLEHFSERTITIGRGTVATPQSPAEEDAAEEEEPAGGETTRDETVKEEKPKGLIPGFEFAAVIASGVLAMFVVLLRRRYE